MLTNQQLLVLKSISPADVTEAAAILIRTAALARLEDQPELYLDEAGVNENRLLEDAAQEVMEFAVGRIDCGFTHHVEARLRARLSWERWAATHPLAAVGMSERDFLRWEGRTENG